MPVERPDVMPKVRDLPHKPGVYLFKDRFDRVIYVGRRATCTSGSASIFIPRGGCGPTAKTQALLESIWDPRITYGEERT